jgi:hypothetical protein
METLRHTFLFRPALWESRGWFYDNAGNRLPCEGQTVITHESDIWINEGSMKVIGPQPMEFTNRYEIAPFKPGLDFTTWQSFNPDLESLSGHFVIVEDAILSPYKSESGQFWGNEFMVQVSEREYRGRGYVFQGDQKLSSWAIQLSMKT